jgi:anthranilate synthase/aminodeoxychorismate synthase-like glutamine amidotransferase
MLYASRKEIASKATKDSKLYKMRLLVIDNYDSFTYNLVQYFGELGASTEVFRNDAISVNDINPEKYGGIVISPGPCDPDRAGISLAVIEKFKGIKPIFGVCLGHQCLGQAFGGKIRRANRLMHGKTSAVQHYNQNLFKGLPNPLTATRYHSLIVDQSSLPKTLKITAKTKEGEIMGLEHISLPIWGVQFHPESLATEKGIMILKNFLNLC